MPKRGTTGWVRQQAGSGALRNAPTYREGGITGRDGAQSGVARVPLIPAGKQERRAADRGDVARIGVSALAQTVHHQSSQGFNGAHGLVRRFSPERHGQDFDINRARRG